MAEHARHADVVALAARIDQLEAEIDRLGQGVNALNNRVGRLEAAGHAAAADRLEQLERRVKEISARLGPRGPARER